MYTYIQITWTRSQYEKVKSMTNLCDEKRERSELYKLSYDTSYIMLENCEYIVCHMLQELQ